MGFLVTENAIDAKIECLKQRGFDNLPKLIASSPPTPIRRNTRAPVYA